MAKIKVPEVPREFNNLDELKSYVTTQFKALQAANDRILSLEKQIATPQPTLPAPHPTYRLDSEIAEEICLFEIEKLQNRSLQTELPLEDVKKLDILVKNLLLLRASRQKKEVDIELPQNEDDLLAIANKDIKKHS